MENACHLIIAEIITLRVFCKGIVFRINFEDLKDFRHKITILMSKMVFIGECNYKNVREVIPGE